MSWALLHVVVYYIATITVVAKLQGVVLSTFYISLMMNE